MFKKFIKNSAIFGISSFLAKGISFFLIPVYTRVLLPSDFGIYDIIITLIAIVGLIFPLEIGQGLFRFLPEAKTKQEKSDFISSAFWFVILVYIIFILLVMPLSGVISNLLFQSQEYKLIIQISTILIITRWLSNIGLLVLLSLLKSLNYSLISFLSTLSTLIFTILFVLVMKMGVYGIVLGYFLGYLTSAIFTIAAIREYIQFDISFNRLKEMLHYSLPLIPSSLGFFSTYYLNRIMINTLMTVNEVGIYGIVNKLITPITLIMNAAASSVNPLIYNSYSSEDTPAQAGDIMRFLISGCLIIFAALSIFSIEIVHLMTTPAYYDASNILPIVALSTFVFGISQFNIGLSIGKKTIKIAIINISTGLINIALNYLLIPKIGLMGAGISTTIAIIVNYLVSMFFSQKYYYIPYPWKRLSAAFCFTLVIIFVSRFTHFETVLISVVVKSGLLLIELLMIFLLKLITIDDLSFFSIKEFFRLINNRLRVNR